MGEESFELALDVRLDVILEFTLGASGWIIVNIARWVCVEIYKRVSRGFYIDGSRVISAVTEYTWGIADSTVWSIFIFKVKC